MVTDTAENNGTELRGMAAIVRHTGYSARVLRRLIRDESFPAAKIVGEWTNDTLLITRWRRERIRIRRRREVND